ncbi:MAG: hypothetical protein HZC40_08015 [Chloroflexi bacterium]|nr:hypothetical protein [Chloroflexota bacterium]
MLSDSIRLPYTVIRGYAVPVVTLDLFHNHAHTAAMAYVDSGALYSIFKSDLAERLNLDFTSGTRVPVKGLDGIQIPVYLHRVGLQIADFQISATIGFSDQLGVGFNLLGRHSIFNQLQFCFNDRDGEITITRLDS